MTVIGYVLYIGHKEHSGVRTSCILSYIINLTIVEFLLKHLKNAHILLF